MLHIRDSTAPKMVNPMFSNVLINFYTSTALQATESEDQQRLRLQVELEFVQCLANPNYLHCKIIQQNVKNIKILKILILHSSCAT